MRASSIASSATALVCLVLAGCLHAPPVHQRALECNELCAVYIGQGDLTKAEVQCDLGLQFAPQYGDIWNNKGLIELRRGNKDLAKQHFIKALRFNQELAQGYNNLGYVYYMEREYGKAHDNFQRALKVNPDYTEARFNLALAFIGLEKLEKARKELRTIIAINPNLADPHYHLGALALQDGEHDEAIEELNKAVALDPAYADAWMTLGASYDAAGRAVEAVDAFTSCIEADPKNVQCRNGLAEAQRKAALQKPGLVEAAKTLSGETTADSQYQLARGFHDQGLTEEEERAYKKCVKLDGRHVPCHFGLFEIYRAERKDKAAAVACKNVLKFASSEEFPKEVQSCEQYAGGN